VYELCSTNKLALPLLACQCAAVATLRHKAKLYSVGQTTLVCISKWLLMFSATGSLVLPEHK